MVTFEGTARGEAGGEMGEPRRASAEEDLEHLAKEPCAALPSGWRGLEEGFSVEKNMARFILLKPKSDHVPSCFKALSGSLSPARAPAAVQDLISHPLPLIHSRGNSDLSEHTVLSSAPEDGLVPAQMSSGEGGFLLESVGPLNFSLFLEKFNSS